MPQFDTYQELEVYLNKELSKRESEIDNILYYWMTKSRTSEMFYQTDKGFVIDTSKAKDHFKLVQLYNILLNDNLTFKERNNPHDITVKSISPRVNEKRLRDFNAFNENQEKVKQQINNLREYANKVAIELNLEHSIDELLSDLNGSREILKKLFKVIFPLYGIELDDKVINRVFGRLEFKKKS